MCDQRFAFLFGDIEFFLVSHNFLVEMHVQTVCFAYFCTNFRLSQLNFVCVIIVVIFLAAGAIEDRKLYVIFGILKRFLQLVQNTIQSREGKGKGRGKNQIRCYKMRDDTISVMFSNAKHAIHFVHANCHSMVLFASSASFWLNINDSQSENSTVGFSHCQYRFRFFFSLSHFVLIIPFRKNMHCIL